MVRAKAAGVVAFKLYPAGATTNSDSGVTDIELVMPTLRAMAEVRFGAEAPVIKPVLCEVIGGPIKPSAKLTGEPIKDGSNGHFAKHRCNPPKPSPHVQSAPRLSLLPCQQRGNPCQGPRDGTWKGTEAAPGASWVHWGDCGAGRRGCCCWCTER